MYCLLDAAIAMAYGHLNVGIVTIGQHLSDIRYIIALEYRVPSDVSVLVSSPVFLLPPLGSQSANDHMSIGPPHSE